MSDLKARIGAAARAWRRPEQALAQHDGAGALPWIVGIIAFLAALALATALALSGAADRWTAGLTGTLTVEIPAEDADDGRPPEQRLAAVLAILRATPGIARAEPVARERLVALLEPWLGSTAASPDLPLPQIIDVTLALDAPVDKAALRASLAAAVPAALIDDHRAWLDGLLRLARLAVALALGVVALVAAAAAGTVVFATRAGLAAHQQAIELLHLMGAHDAHIARQFARLAFIRSAVGAVGGVGVALATFYALSLAARRIDPMLLASVGLGVGDWLAVLMLPLAAAAVATLAAWHTVASALKKML